MALWVGALCLWPRKVNRREVTAIDNSNAVTGEVSTANAGLFSPELTKAPFGLTGVDFYESFQGKKRWNIKSKFAELHRKENYAFLQVVDSDFFSERSGNRIHTQSKYGRSRLDKQRLDLEGDVTIHSKRGYLFEMDRLAYEGTTHEFNSEDPVSMKGPDINQPAMLLKGIGLVGNIDTEHFLVKKNVTAQRRLKSNEWLKISSRAGEFFTEEQRAVFIGKVKAVMPRLNVESDVFELSISQEKESIRARGNVVMRQRNMVGRAETAGMELGSSRIILEGNAKIDSKGDQIRGKKIVVYTDEDRVEVESAEGSVQ